MTNWQNRITRHGVQSADQFLANPRNPRKHPQKQRDAVKGSLNTLGWIAPVIVNARTGYMIDGHERVWQALQNDNAEVPFIEVDLSEAEENLALASFDWITHLAVYDPDNLDALLRDVQTDDVALQAVIAELADSVGLYTDDAVPVEDGGAQLDKADELRQKWQTERGQLWVIPSPQGGEHRLLCGDSTSAEDVARLMAGEKAQLVVTSPPYAQQREYGDSARESVSDWDALMNGVFGLLPTDKNAQVLVNLGLVHRDSEWLPYWDKWIDWMRSQGWRRFGWYVWDQMNGLPGDWSGRLAPSHEFVFHFNRVSVRPEKNVPSKMAGKRAKGRTFRKSDGSLETFTHDGALVQSTKIPDSVIRVNRQVGSDGHPAQYSLEFASALVNAWNGELVYEPFGGSGTTMVACEQLGRQCRMIEIEPKYVAVILERMAALGLKPQLVEHHE